MHLVSVIYKVGLSDQGTQYGRDTDNEAKHDAERCVRALLKRFPDYEFSSAQVKLGTYNIHTNAGISNPTAEVMRGFAEGFIASSDLWER